MILQLVWRTMATAAAVVAATLPVGAVSAVAQANESDVIAQPFEADSGDPCPMGFTEGVLLWQADVAPRVSVRGVVGDQPLSVVPPPSKCGDDGRSTVATFSALATGWPPAVFTVAADNGQVSFLRTLSSAHPIEAVTVQVCRRAQTGTQIQCGALKRYPRPIFVG